MSRLLSLAPALALTLALGAASQARAGEIRVDGAFARASTMMSQSGAAFMVIHNDGAEADRLVSARADVSAKVELHTHRDVGGGVVRMVEVEEGFVVPAHGSHALARGADHVMFLGLTAPFEDGMAFPLTLVFEKAGEVVVDVPVMNTNAGGAAMPAGHGMKGMPSN